jgi:hypothetical protein
MSKPPAFKGVRSDSLSVRISLPAPRLDLRLLERGPGYGGQLEQLRAGDPTQQPITAPLDLLAAGGYPETR